MRACKAFGGDVDMCAMSGCRAGEEKRLSGGPFSEVVRYGRVDLHGEDVNV